MKLSLTILFFTLATIVWGIQHDETLAFKQISTQDGLSQNTVRSVIVDGRGYIWAGTLDGLNRYDGTRFLTYKPKFGKSVALNDHRVKTIVEDANQLIWIRKYDNTFSCYNHDNESFLLANNHSKQLPFNYANQLLASDSSIWFWDSRNGCMQVKWNEKTLDVSFLSEPTNSRLTHIGIENIIEDSQQNIWICGITGLNLISKDGSVQQFFQNETQYRFRRMVEHQGILYFITDASTIHRYDLKRKKFINQLVAPGQIRFLDGAMLNDKQLLITSRSHGLLRLNIQNESFDFNVFAEKRAFGNSPQLVTDRKKNIWIYDHSGYVKHFDPHTQRITELQLIPSQIISVIDNERYNFFIDSKDQYWITTYGNGLFRYDPSSGNLENYRYHPQSNSPASDYLLSIAEDKTGNLWIGSEYAGLIKVVKQNYKVNYIRPEANNLPGTGNNVKVIFEDSKENVWVGTKNGSLYLYNKTLTNSRLIHKNMNPYTIIEDHKNRIWIGTKGNGIYVYDAHGSRELMHFTNNENDSKTLGNNSIFSLLLDKDNRIWVASFGGGLDLFDESDGNKQFVHFFYDDGNKSFIRYLFQDSQGNIWAGSYEGLISFKPNELISNPNIYKLFSYNPNEEEGLNCNDIKTIFEDSRKQLWIGTAGGGLNLFQKDENGKGIFTKFTTKQGLPSDIVTAMLESRDSMLWISTENGIAQYNAATNTFMTYLFSDDTRGNYYSENAAMLRRNGEMLWGTLDGMIAFNPNKFVRNRNVPPVMLTDFFVFDQRLDPQSPHSPLEQAIGNTKTLAINHKQNTFTLHFASLNLTNPAMNKYSYMLEPFDKFWSSPTNITEATYKNLPPGKYIFKVKGANPDGIWSDEITEIFIDVKPPWWKSKWAQIMYVVVTLMLLYSTFMVIFRLNILNNAVKIEKQLTDYKLRFFTNISHEFRTPLTLIRSAVESLSEQKDLPEPTQKQVALLDRNAKQMNRLIDQLLEFRKIQNNVLTLNLELTELSEYMLNIFYTFKEVATHKNIEYTFNMNPEKWELYIDRNKVEKIVFNLLSNAFKFTPVNGKIEFKIEKNDETDRCIILVCDSGLGIPKEKQHLLFSRFMQINFSSEGTGVGLSLVKEFTEAHKGRVWFEENKGGGSIFQVELPASASTYNDVNFIPSGTEHHEPLVADIESEALQIEGDFVKPESPHEWRILIIDDNKDIRDFLTEELGKHFKTETAENGRIGLEMAINNNPDLIICDVKMPEMDGIEVTSRLKNDFQTSHIPIILLTALSSDSLKLRGSECGADAYIMKPFSLKYLLSRVYKLIEQREKLRKRYSVDIENKENPLSNNDKDKEFHDLITKILEENMANPNFSVEEFTELSGQKRTIFYKKVKGLTGYSPNELIKIKRMKRAAELLLEGKHTVSEVSWKVGIEDQFYFSKCFKAQFGCAPSKYGNKE